MIDHRENAELAQDLRTFADRVEDGELEITEVQLWNCDKPAVRIEGMNSDELERLRKVF